MKKQLNIIILFLLVICFPWLANSSSIEIVSCERYVYASLNDYSGNVVASQSEYRGYPHDTSGNIEKLNAYVAVPDDPLEKEADSLFSISSNIYRNYYDPLNMRYADIALNLGISGAGFGSANYYNYSSGYFILSMYSPVSVNYWAAGLGGQGAAGWGGNIDGTWILDGTVDLDTIKSGFGVINSSHILSDYTDWGDLEGDNYNYGTLPAGTFHLASRTFAIDKNFANYHIRFQPTPEPTTMFLVGAGLIGLAVFGRKKFRN